MEREAQRFFAYAADVLEPRDVISLTVVGGLSGTGKSTMAQALASTIGRTPGAVVLRSDIVRKTIMGVDWTSGWKRALTRKP
jgi:predicted kinase